MISRIPFTIALFAGLTSSAFAGGFWTFTEVEQADMVADRIDAAIDCSASELAPRQDELCEVMDTLDDLLDDTEAVYGSLEAAIEAGGELVDPNDMYEAIIDQLEDPDTNKGWTPAGNGWKPIRK